MRKIIVAFLLFFACPVFSQVQEYTLKNGLKVLVKEDHRAPVAVSMIWYNVGSADEPGGITGVSHAIEHMMFKGTPKFPIGVFSKTIAAIGGQDNAFTNNDYTAFFEKVSAGNLETCFKLEADRMNNLILDANEFAQEMKVIREERRLRTDDNPQALAFERFLATAHLTSAYNHPVIGWMSDLHQMTVQDIKNWYENFYGPNNATLVVVGDVNPEMVHALAEKYFGTIAKKKVLTRKSQEAPPALGKKVVLIHAPAKLPLLLMGFNAPSLVTSPNKSDPYALELIAGILDAGNGSRFAKNLIRGSQVATGADVYYNLYARYPTQFVIYGAPTQNNQISDLQKSILSELDVLKTVPVSEKELQRIKTQIIAQKTFEKDSIFGQAMELGLLETVGIGWQHTNDYIKEINAVTPEQIQQTAQRYFQENNRTDAELIPTNANEVKS